MNAYFAVELELQRSELEALIRWHLDRANSSFDPEGYYLAAGIHSERAAELIDLYLNKDQAAPRTHL